MQPQSHEPQQHGRQNPYAQGPQFAPGAQTADPRAQLASGVDQFMIRVNAWMTAGVGVTGLVAFAVSLNEAMVRTLLYSPVRWVVWLAPLLLVWGVAGRIQKMSRNAAIAVFMLYAALTGLMLSTIFVFFSLGSIASVFAITAMMYGSLALWGYVTKRDLSAWGKFLFMGMIGLIVSSIAFMFVPTTLSGPAFLIYNLIGVLIFSGLTAYMTQKIKQVYLVNGGAGNLAILGALVLYISFINLFIVLLNLFGGGRD